jgi:hypothetical protein
LLLRRHNTPRRGTTLPEAALTLTVFLTLILGTLDLGLAVFRQNVLSHAARQGARKAAVHGSLAKSGWNGGPWGPTTYGPKAATDSDVKAQAVAAALAGMDASAVQVTFEWPDNSNVSEKRVRVTVTTTWQPIFLFIFGNQTTTLSASSTMPIAH